MELAIVKYIKEHGLFKTVNDFNLIYKEYPNKVLLKYSQTESPFKCEEVRDARGIILDKHDWSVMSLGFRKFFNNGETNAAKIDWKSAHVLEKIDGSFAQVYFDKYLNEWCIGSSGTAEGEGVVFGRITFKDLFYMSAKGMNFDKLIKGNTYCFELTTPHNIVVTPHRDFNVTLLAIRELSNLTEFKYKDVIKIGDELNVKTVKRFPLNNNSEILKTFVGLPFYHEGYVVIDKNFSRVKIKNPAYLAAHHLKNNCAPHSILDIIKTNEIDEFVATFKELEPMVRDLNKKYHDLVSRLEKCWVILKSLKPTSIEPKEKKRFAECVFNVCEEFNVKNFSSIFFLLNDYKITDIKTYMADYDNKKLYDILNSK